MKYYKNIGGNYLLRQAVTAAILPLLFCAGCSVIKEDTTSVIFSEDDSMVGYSWIFQDLWGEMDEGYLKGTTYEYVGFARTDTPQTTYILQTLKKKKTPNFATESLVKYVAISPDNKKMAIVSSNAVDIMDIATFKLNRLTMKDERIGTLRWLNAEEVVYTSILPPAKNETVTYKCVFRQYFSSDEGNRVTLFRDLTNLYEQDAFAEFWSPDGKTMLLLGQLHIRLLDVETGRLSNSLLERFGENRGVVWSPDSKRLFIAFGWSWDQKGKCGGILVQLKPLKVTDYSTQVRQTFYTEPFRVLDWTKDGKYIIGWGMQLQTCLIDPDGWKVFWFEEKYNESLPKYQS
ncbi:MAG TPA: hypothetical protein PLK08_06470, partial [Phycisphaerae bacterium]|nr:hypothetical protein [Phycisphaerae bacterium]